MVAKVEEPNNVLDLIDDRNARRGTGERISTGNRPKRWEGAIWKKLGRKSWHGDLEKRGRKR